MVGEIAYPVNGEAKVREVVNAHKDWNVLATDYKKGMEDAPGEVCVIFYLETSYAKTYTDIDGVKRVAKAMFIEHFKASRIAKEPDGVGRQLINTANTRLSDNMRSTK